MTDIFCQIINKEINAEIIDEGKDWIAFKDIHPQAPVHVLIVPKKHIFKLDEANEQDKRLLGELVLAAQKVAKKLNIDKSGYRLILNQGEHGGQIVEHLHFHLLGGRHLGSKIVK